MPDETPGDAPRFEAPHPNGSAQEPTREQRRGRLGLAFGVLGVLLFCVGIVWGYVVFGSNSPEKLDDASAAEFERACADATDRLRALPDPGPATQAAESARVDAENEEFRALIQQLRAIEPDDATPASALNSWTDDLEAVVNARAQYAIDVRDDATAKLVLPSARGIKPVTAPMDDFVREQSGRVPSCIVEAMQLETVAKVRIYDGE